MDSRKLLECLADNEYHSGNRLSSQAGVSRTAVWKEIKKLRRFGLTINSRHGKGYRLEDALEFLEETEIRNEIDQPAAGSRIEVLFETDSTNGYLIDRLGSPDFHNYIVLAECQHDGKGRRGKTWVSPFAGGLYLSIGWRFEAPPASLNALSLAAGVAVIDALKKLGMTGVYLKWPNDVICDHKKMGGILLQSRSETGVSCDVVIGIGINVCLPGELKSAIEQPATDLSSNFGQLPSKNKLAGKIIGGQVAMLNHVADEGMGEYIAEWRKLDYLSGRKAELLLSGQSLKGRVKGVDDNGLLLMEINGVTRKFSSGEISVRVDN